ncbi:MULTISPECIES: VOC family protein [Brevibacterium]|uniref:VOC family protein n=1 Tax=Brevibacterium ammoniilyticum TaxID=1046555 RepID=A0ABP9U344_9MICO
MAISPHVFFSGGRCAAAFERYRDIFGGELSIMLSKDAPPEARMPGAPEDSVMHAVLNLGDSLIMGADDPTGTGDAMSGVALNFTAPDPDAAKRVFDILAEGGEVQMPFAPTFWSAGFGACVDQFGVPWMIDTAQGAGPA